MERSRVAVSVLGLPLHPCKGFVYTVTTRQRCLKINQPKADKECSYGKGMGWMQEDEMFKRFESKPKTRSKRQPLQWYKNIPGFSRSLQTPQGDGWLRLK